MSFQGYKVTLTLTETERFSGAKKYRIESIRNSVEWSIGDYLTKEEVQKIIDREEQLVEVLLKAEKGR
jgi:hypothetical protein